MRQQSGSRAHTMPGTDTVASLPHTQALCLLPAARRLAVLCDGTVTLLDSETLVGSALPAARGATLMAMVRHFFRSLQAVLCERLTRARRRTVKPAPGRGWLLR